MIRAKPGICIAGHDMALDDEILRKVWEKGEAASNVDPDIWRKDACGAWMRRDFYNDAESQFGWAVDLVIPEASGGGRDLSNLRPLQWQNKMAKHGRYLRCPITALGKYNVPRRRRRGRMGRIPLAGGDAGTRQEPSDSDRSRTA